MKILLGFFMGTTVGLLVVLFIFHNSNQVSADSAATAVSAAYPTTTTPDGTDVVGLIPDVKKIYYSALVDPYRQVEKEITDPDIAAYFHKYMEDTGLDKVGLNP